MSDEERRAAVADGDVQGAVDASTVDPEVPSVPFHVVAIGASAGGLEALERFFANASRRSKMAYVVLQHLSPDFESRMDELLARQTAIPIRRVEDGMPVEPDHIYLFPPRKDMIISGGRLLLKDREPDRGLALPIDEFFRSLAQDVGPNAIGIVLSGTGSDGSRGVRAIHDSGGLVMVQRPETARFDGMPLSAQETGCVDVLLAPEDMPRALARFVDDGRPRPRRTEPDEDAVPVTRDDKVRRIFELLRSEYGIDFAAYKPSTVTRRIERRINLGGAESLDAYLDQLEQDPEELRRLYSDLLIGVTGFFRDPKAFERLEQDVVPAIISRVTGEDEVRVWVAGCATGEEAYSLAILLHEQLTAAGRKPNVKIFATDVDRGALDIASTGRYDASSLTEVGSRRRKRYFTRSGDSFQVHASLRRMIVFARHNVLRDAPFTRLDLVTCRNLLIYLRNPAQRKALSLFHFGLKTGGVLFLGSSESTGELSSAFEPIDAYWKVYKKRHDLTLPRDMRLTAPMQSSPLTSTRERWGRAGSGGGGGAGGAGTPGHPGANNLLPVYDRLLDGYMPPSLLVDDQLELVHAFGGAERFLRLRGGRPSASVLSLVDEGLKPAVSGAIQHAERERGSVCYSGLRIAMPGRDEPATIRLTVEPVQAANAPSTHFLISIEEMTSSGVVTERREESTDLSAEAVSQDYIERLENELRSTRENLQATIEELETSNEELQATNEELVASNEELQSTNEELHSVNEELYTVNAEHQRKITELSELTQDMDNLLQSTDLGVVFLDENLAIRKFTARMASIFKLLPRDIGRPFDVFAKNIDHVGLVDDLRRVAESRAGIEREVQDHEGRFYLLRILPYAQDERDTGAIVMTLVDIGGLKRAEARARRLSAIVESSEDAIVGTDTRGHIQTWNLGAQKLYGPNDEDVLGRPLVGVIAAPDDRERLADCLASALRGTSTTQLELAAITGDRRRIEISAGIYPTRDELDRIVGASVLARDVTHKKRAEREVRQAVRQRDQFLAMLSHELRNPLSAIVNAVHLLERGAGIGQQVKTKALAIVGRQTRHMARLLDDLLDVSRMRQDRIEMRMTSVELRSCVDHVIEANAALFDNAGIELDVDLDDEPIHIHADPARLEQVITNLLTNAVRYSPAGATVHVSLTREDDDELGGRAILSVKDGGRGISADMLERIFEPFVRAEHIESDESRVGEQNGMGLGLALVRAIVDAHEGSVVARSEGLGHGAEFVVELPLRNAAVDEHGSPVVGKRERPLVVLVEDQIDNQDMLRAILEDNGYDVATADDGPSGLATILDTRPDVALVDVGLPGLRGDEIARRVRQRLGRDLVALIALTGFGQQQDRETIFAAGFDHHLVKPVDVEVLLDVIERVLSAR